MKKIILLLLLVPLLFASDIKTEQKIYGLIIHALLPQKTEIRVWTDSQSPTNIFCLIKDVRCVNNPENADFLLLSKKKNIQTKGIKFATNIQLLEAEKDTIVGGFFWEKGRPNILFLRKNLQKHNITLPKSMQEYIEDEL